MICVSWSSFYCTWSKLTVSIEPEQLLIQIIIVVIHLCRFASRSVWVCSRMSVTFWKVKILVRNCGGSGFELISKREILKSENDKFVDGFFIAILTSWPATLFGRKWKIVFENDIFKRKIRNFVDICGNLPLNIQTAIILYIFFVRCIFIGNFF